MNASIAQEWMVRVIVAYLETLGCVVEWTTSPDRVVAVEKDVMVFRATRQWGEGHWWCEWWTGHSINWKDWPAPELGLTGTARASFALLAGKDQAKVK